MRNTHFRSTVRAMAEGAEAEFSRLVAYMNDAVVPEVRRGSSIGLRAAAKQLGRLAEQLDHPAAHRATARPSTNPFSGARSESL